MALECQTWVATETGQASLAGTLEGPASSDKARQGSTATLDIDEIRYHSTHLMMAEKPFGLKTHLQIQTALASGQLDLSPR